MLHRHRFTPDFKRDAVRLVEERGNLSAVARELGVSDTSLCAWRKQLQQTPDHPFPGNGNPRDAQLAHLQREIARLKEENEILKKAVGICTVRPR